MNTTCAFCGNKNLSNKKVRYIYQKNGNYLFVNDVPCIQCDYCGEQYFEGKEILKIENSYNEIMNNKKKTLHKLEIPVENFSEIF
jgi:YgiT-type zinc finger domain-containing protein